jgi:hypothetical protein
MASKSKEGQENKPTQVTPSLSQGPQWSSWEKKRHPDNPVVFLDVEIQGHPAGKIYIEVRLWNSTNFNVKLLLTNAAYQLYADIVPRTAENFRQFCTGEHRWVFTAKESRNIIFEHSCAAQKRQHPTWVQE